MYDASAPRYFPIARMRPDDSPTMRTPEKMRNDVIFAAGFYAINVTGSEYAMCHGTRILPWPIKKRLFRKSAFFKKAVLPFVELSEESVLSDRFLFKVKILIKKRKREKEKEHDPNNILLHILIFK